MARVRGRLYLRGHARAAIEARIEASRMAAEHILGVANDLVPLDEGPLQNSGHVRVSPGGAQAQIYYDTPYAVVQHENLDYRHAPGRQAKYLEQPMTTERDVALAIMAAVLRGAFASGGGGG